MDTRRVVAARANRPDYAALYLIAENSIAHHIEEAPEHRGPARARLRDSGMEVWVLVAQLPAMDGDPARLAEGYGLPVEAIDAALAYYRRHKKLIDAQIALNAA